MLFEKGEPVCNSCHWKIHKGYHICPVCKKNLTKYEQCWNCIPDEVKESFEVKKILRNKLRREIRKKIHIKYTKVNKNVYYSVLKPDLFALTPIGQFLSIQIFKGSFIQGLSTY